MLFSTFGRPPNLQFNKFGWQPYQKMKFNFIVVMIIIRYACLILIAVNHVLNIYKGLLLKQKTFKQTSANKELSTYIAAH